MPDAMKISSVKVTLHSSYMKNAVSVNITKEKGTKKKNNMEYHNIISFFYVIKLSSGNDNVLPPR